MKAAQKKPIKIVLSRSLCKLVIGGTGVSTGGGPRVQNEVSPNEKSNG